ncbi:MAG: hypothetical protein ABIW47_06500, partial [Ginsengibacter sp.]
VVQNIERKFVRHEFRLHGGHKNLIGKEKPQNIGRKQSYAERNHEFGQHHCGSPDSCLTNRIAYGWFDSFDF